MVNEYLKNYLITLKKTDKKAILEVSQSVEKQIPSQYRDEYLNAVKNIIYVLSIGLALKDKISFKISSILSQKKIPVNVWARYMVSSIWFSSLILAERKNKNSLKNALLVSLSNFNKEINELKQKTKTINESTFISENIIKNSFNKIVNVIKHSTFVLGKALGMFVFTTVDLYNQAFSFVSYPIKVLAEKIPCGDILVKYGIGKFVLSNLSPVGTILFNIHMFITSSMTKQGIDFAKQIINGTFWNNVDKFIGDLTRDLNIEDLENEINKINNSELDEIQLQKETNK